MCYDHPVGEGTVLVLPLGRPGLPQVQTLGVDFGGLVFSRRRVRVFLLGWLGLPSMLLFVS